MILGHLERVRFLQKRLCRRARHPRPTRPRRPPAYSAIKVEGERAYDLAREGEAPSLAPRPILIHAVRLIEMPDADHAVFEVECGKGSYIRAWVRDLAEALGTVGHVAEFVSSRLACREQG